MIRLLAALALLAATPLRAEVDITQVPVDGAPDAWLVAEPSIPFVAIELVFEGGATLDPEDRAGRTALMTALLEEGAGDLDAEGYAARTEALAARFAFESGRDRVTVSARFLTENAEQAIDHLRLALVAPRFDADAITRVRGQLLASLQRDARDPNALASRAFAQAAFPDHPYGRPADGTRESVAALERDDLVAAHEDAIARDKVHVGAAGDIGPDRLAALLARLFDGMPARGKPLPPHAEFAAARRV